MLKLYDTPVSGNCYKARLLLSFLQLSHETIPMDLKSGAQKAPEFLRLNTFGQVPVLQDGDIVIRDSQAILVYLAKKFATDSWLAEQPAGLAKIHQWLSNAANEIANGFAAARAYWKFNRSDIDIAKASERAQSFLKVMDRHLADRQWLELDRPTIADVACFPYIALSHEGRISLAEYPHVAAWIKRFTQLPNFIPMPGQL